MNLLRITTYIQSGSRNGQEEKAVVNHSSYKQFFLTSDTSNCMQIGEVLHPLSYALFFLHDGLRIINSNLMLVLLILLSLKENIISLPKVGQGFLMAAEEKGEYF